MKSGISLVDMAKEIQRQADLKADYMLDTRSLRLEPFDSKLYLNAYDQSGVPALEPLEVNSIAHRQIGTHLRFQEPTMTRCWRNIPSCWHKM